MIVQIMYNRNILFNHFLIFINLSVLLQSLHLFQSRKPDVVKKKGTASEYKQTIIFWMQYDWIHTCGFVCIAITNTAIHTFITSILLNVFLFK